MKETAIIQLSKDLRESAKNLSREEAGALITTYYVVQDFRIRSNNQGKALERMKLPNNLSGWLTDNFETMEKYVQKLLDYYSMAHPVGVWARDQIGIGPVIAAGLIAYVDPEKAITAGHVWAYAGLKPYQRKRKGEKLDYNPDFKQLAFHIGESFARQSHREDAFYCIIYKQRKVYEVAKNERGDYAEEAKRILSEKKFERDTKAKELLLSGKLPPFGIERRCRRYAAKIFLSHFQQKLYEHHFGRPAPVPFPIAHLGHTHYVAPPESKS